MDLLKDIETVLVGGGLNFREVSFSGVPVISCTGADGHRNAILPLEIKANTLEEARRQQEKLLQVIDSIKSETAVEACTSFLRESSCIARPDDPAGVALAPGRPPIIVTEDRWVRNREAMSLRLLAHLGKFTGIFARNCQVEKISRTDACAFLEDNHSYGDAKSRYHYGIYYKGKLVAAAEFSNARKWKKAPGDLPDGPREGMIQPLVIKSYEWVRYASLPGTRIVGGMGKVLKRFIEDHQPDDVMSYADLEWSEGSVYQALGFECEGLRRPVFFRINAAMEREALPAGMAGAASAVSRGLDGGQPGDRYLMNFGSMKYRLKLTDYK